MNGDYLRLRELGKELAEIAALPVQEEKKKLWIANNDLKPVRPMVYIDEIPWHEIDNSPELRQVCEDPFLRSIEDHILKLLYRWKHFPCDMVVEKYLSIPKTVRGLNYGAHVVEDAIKTSDKNGIYSHKYHDQLATQEQLDAVKPDVIETDPELDRRRLEICNEIFNGIMPVRLHGIQIYACVWDNITEMRSVEKILWDLVDRPEFIIQTVQKLVDITMSAIDQCEKLGLLDANLQYVHCTGAYTGDLPQKDYDGGNARPKDCWGRGMAQAFAVVSPAMHEEFEVDLVKPVLERFGLLYYGCCEPLERKIGIIRKFSNLRKISISPYSNIDESADNIGKDYVLSLKQNPAFLVNGINEREIRAQMETALNACKRNGSPLEIIMKDISTVSGRADSLDRWNCITMEYVERFMQ
jgi:hypothetical protein